MRRKEYHGIARGRARLLRFNFQASNLILNGTAKNLLIQIALIVCIVQVQAAERPRDVTGLVHIPSRYSVGETIERLESELIRRGMRIFDRIDFESDAMNAGLVMRPTKLLIFGNPKVGTPLMNAEPTVAIDLPLKALVWEDAEGKVWLSYNAADYLQERHHLNPELLEKMRGIAGLMESVAGNEQKE